MCIMKPLLVYISVFLGSFASVYGSVITFQGTPRTVIDGLTDNVRLRCSLLDTDSTVIGGVIGRRDVTMTIGNVEQVSSIIITKDGVDVASVAVSHAAKVMANDTNIHATGDVTKMTGERGFLELSVQYPTPAQIGEYGCEVVAVSSTGHGVIFTTNVEINSSQPTLGDLIHEINHGKIRENQQSNIIQTLQQTVASLQQQVSNLEAGNGFNTSVGGLQVRLLGGLMGTFGAVQLRYNGTTGMLCDDYFSRNNNGAHVVCRMLGFTRGIYEDGNHFVDRNGGSDHPDIFLLDDVVCNGSETDLTQCSHNGWGKEGVCMYSELAGVRCS